MLSSFSVSSLSEAEVREGPLEVALLVRLVETGASLTTGSAKVDGLGSGSTLSRALLLIGVEVIAAAADILFVLRARERPAPLRLFRIEGVAGRSGRSGSSS